MTIFHFRRRSKEHVDERPVLEASTSSSRFLLADFDNKDNVVVDSDFYKSSSHDDGESSTSTHYSNAGASSSNDGDDHEESKDNKAAASKDEKQPSGEDDDDDEAAELAQAILNDYEVKLDDNDESVKVTMDVPSDTNVEDLSVHVDDGILRVSGEIFTTDSSDSDSTSNENEASNTHHHRRASSSVQQAFQLDEQALDIDNLTANLSSEGLLTITAPKKDPNTAGLSLESLPIQNGVKPPRLLSVTDAFRLIIDLPGVNVEDIYVTYNNGKLRVSANRHFGRVRSFKRTIPVDTQQYDADKLETYLYRGQLTVIIPPKQQRVSRIVKIQTEEALSSVLGGGMKRSSSASSLAALAEEFSDSDSLSSESKH